MRDRSSSTLTGKTRALTTETGIGILKLIFCSLPIVSLNSIMTRQFALLACLVAIMIGAAHAEEQYGANRKLL